MDSQKIFLVRHGAYSGEGDDPSLSDSGKKQASELADKIQEILGENASLTIWTSTANRAGETASIIGSKFTYSQCIRKSQLRSNARGGYDPDWLKEEIEKFNSGNLLIVSHLEYVRDFPEFMGFSSNKASYGQGVLIEDGHCVDFG